MSQRRSSSSHGPHAATAAVAEHAPGAGVKGSIKLRIDAQTRRLIDEAAAVLGMTRSQFMIESARNAAIDVLLDERLIVLEPARYDAFVQALESPPAPGPKLRSLMRRVPAWES